MHRSFALTLLSLVAVPTILALRLGDGPMSSHAARSLTAPYGDIMVREITDAVVSELSRRGLDVDNFFERRTEDSIDTAANKGQGAPEKTKKRGKTKKGRTKQPKTPESGSDGGVRLKQDAESSDPDNGGGVRLGQGN